MRIINKKFLLIVLLVGIIITGVIIFKPKENVKLDNVILRHEVDKKSFAMYIKNDDEYEAYEGTKFPEGYDLDLNESRCIDNNGQEIEDVLSYKNGEVTITSGKTTYCYLYFDLLEEKEFEYTGNYQVFIAPKDGNYEVELWGASGGSTETGALGGNGAYTKGTIELKKQDKLYIFVGEGGHSYTPRVRYVFLKTFNGGGGGRQHEYTATSSGGGATDIRLNISEAGNWNDFDSLKSRIMVAAGGGGGMWWSNVKNMNGGCGGTLIGGDGELKYTPREPDTRVLAYAIGGTQTLGGAPNDKKTEGAFGKFGIGGNINIPQSAICVGGGSGYYGGGGGVDEGMTGISGAGGSSFISGYKGCIAIDGNSTEEDIKSKDGCINEDPDVKCSYHYSGKVFTNTEMKAGNESMPTYDGNSTMIGNTGNGYAKIKLVQ